jgi:hypothetical protein
MAAGLASFAAIAGTNPPQFAPGVVIPACYNSTNGNLRLVRPWGVAGVPGGEPNCRPPAPWDTLDVPAGGFDATACNTGGVFDCRFGEDYTEIDTQGLQGPAGPRGPRGFSVSVTPIPNPDTQCGGFGGQILQVVDDSNNPLGAPTLVCNGAKGDTGAPGKDGVSVTTAAEAAGTNCANGGVQLTAASGVSYVCNGANGKDGKDGTNGTNGSNGRDGVSITSAVEPPGSNCAIGGARFTAVNGTTYACNGSGGGLSDITGAACEIPGTWFGTTGRIGIEADGALHCSAATLNVGARGGTNTSLVQTYLVKVWAGATTYPTIDSGTSVCFGSGAVALCSSFVTPGSTVQLFALAKQIGSYLPVRWSGCDSVVDNGTAGAICTVTVGAIGEMRGVAAEPVIPP